MPGTVASWLIATRKTTAKATRSQAASRESDRLTGAKNWNRAQAATMSRTTTRYSPATASLKVLSEALMSVAVLAASPGVTRPSTTTRTATPEIAASTSSATPAMTPARRIGPDSISRSNDGEAEEAWVTLGVRGAG